MKAHYLKAILKDSTYKFADDIRTPGIETLRDMVYYRFKEATGELKKLSKDENLRLGKL